MTVYVHPLDDTEVEFDESVTLTLLNISNYAVFPSQSASILLSDNFGTNVFVPVVTNLSSPIGIDYHPVSNALVVSVNFNDNGQRMNFVLINSNGVAITNWSGVAGAPDEVKLATVKTSAYGFTNGDGYFASENNIGWVSADGTRSNLTWC